MNIENNILLYYNSIYLLQNPDLLGLYNTHKLVNCDISNINYHEVHTNLRLLLHNLPCGHQATFFLILRLTGFIKLTDQPIMTEQTKDRIDARPNIYLLITHILYLINFFKLIILTRTSCTVDMVVNLSFFVS